MVRLDQASSAMAIGSCFLVLGAGFGTVMVTATAVIVHEASVDAAGVAGGLQQTAMNVGPTLGVAAAATLMTLAAPDPARSRPPGDGPLRAGDAATFSMEPALVALAAVAVIGALLALRLPGRSSRQAPAEDR